MAGNLPASGEILRLREVVEMNNQQKAVVKAIRVLGKLSSHDFETRQAVIRSAERNDQTSQLTIDTKLIEPFEARLGAIFQFIGELDLNPSTGLILHARVVQRVDGIDVAMYYSALDMQREYLASR